MRVVMLVGNGQSSKFMYNALKKKYQIIKVIQEENVSKTKMIKRRIKKLGLIKVLGQIIFIIFVSFTKIFSKKRINLLIEEYELDSTPFENEVLIKVKNVNSQTTINEIKKIKPDVVIINGTRIISKKVLNSVEAIFVNTHLGITPKYRGVHGGYWAIANSDIENCGTTVHLVDKGIDTGGILFQEKIKVSKNDNFWTYPIHQISTGIDLMKKTLDGIEKGIVEIKLNDLESKLWSHPDIYTYVKNYILKKVK